MYGTKAEWYLGSAVGKGALSTYPRLTANWKKPLSARYLKCHVRAAEPVPAKNLATTLGRIRWIGVPGPTVRQKDRRMASVVLNRWTIVLRKST
jgi:hypothetical protein